MKSNIAFSEETSQRWKKAIEEFSLDNEKEAKKHLIVFEGFECLESNVNIEGIKFSSLCEHHLFPFFGEIEISLKYNKGASYLGLSKFSRIVRTFCKTITCQEKLVYDLGTFFWENLSLEYLNISMEALHTCQTTRGVEERDAKMKTSFSKYKECKNEKE